MAKRKPGSPEQQPSPNKLKIDGKLRFTIGVRFITFAFIVTVLSGGTVGFVLIDASRNSLRQQVLQNNLDMAELSAAFTSNYISTIQAHVRTIAAHPDIVRATSNNSWGLAQGVLDQFMKVQTELDDVGIYDTNGIQKVSSTVNATSIGQSFADHDWFQQVVATRQPYQGTPTKTRATGMPITTYAVPILDQQGEVIGVLGGSISLDRLSNSIVNINFGTDTHATIVDSRNGGIIIANPDTRLLLRPIALNYGLARRVLAGEKGNTEYKNIGGELQFIGFAPVYGLPWGIIVTTPSRTALAIIDTLTQEVKLLTGLIVLVAALFGAVLMLGVTRPLRRLVEATKDIGSGNLDRVIVTSGNDEVAELALSISQMSQALKSTLVSRDELIKEIAVRKKAEKTLKLQADLLDLQSDSAYVCDLEGNITYVNKATCLTHGYTQEECLNMNLRGLDDLESAAFIAPRIKQLLEKGSATFEVNHLRKDGSLLPLESHASLIEIDGNKMIMNVAHDITERQQAQKAAEAHLQAIAKKAKEWQDTVDAVSDIVVLLSPQHEFLRVNRGLAEVTDKKSEEVIGKKCYELVHGLTSPIDGCPCAETMTTQKSCSREIVDRGRSYIAVAAPIMDENGQMTAIAHTIKDITDSKRIEEERKKADKLESIGALAGGIAHDFNNVLTGILGNIQMTQSYLKQNKKESADEVLSEAERESLRARNLTQQLLTFSRGGIPIKKVTEIDSLLRESATFALRGSNISPRFAIPENLLAVEADEGQLNQVISNLVINAKQAMPNGGTINISVRNITLKTNQIPPLPESTYVEISIEDHGIGIPKGYFEKVFEPYFTTKQTGNGLGLATSFSIVKNHGGTITFDSELGKGTIFRVYLPATKEKIKGTQATSTATVTRSQMTLGGKILVMDDEESILTLLSRMLVNSGYEVETSKNGDEAIEKYSAAKKSGKGFDVVILDLTVPGGKGGKEVLAKLLEIDPLVKAIVSSGYANDPIMAHYKKYGFTGVVAKPYDINLMKEKLNNILANK